MQMVSGATGAPSRSTLPPAGAGADDDDDMVSGGRAARSDGRSDPGRVGAVRNARVGIGLDYSAAMSVGCAAMR
jgi:hypothetical protein